MNEQPSYIKSPIYPQVITINAVADTEFKVLIYLEFKIVNYKFIHI